MSEPERQLRRHMTFLRVVSEFIGGIDGDPDGAFASFFQFPPAHQENKKSPAGD